MNRFKMAVAVAAMTAFAGPALAGTWAEPVVETPPAPVMPSYTAYDWTGGYIGGTLGYSWLSTNFFGDSDGINYGAFAGYMHQMNNVVLGVEGEYRMFGAGAGGPNFDINSVIRLKGRLGVAQDNMLFYVTGGAAYASATGGFTDWNDWGYFGGVGAEFALGNNWTAGVEGTYTSFSDFDNTGVDINATAVNARLSYRF